MSKILQDEIGFCDTDIGAPIICPIPDVNKFPFDGSIPTTTIFEHFAEHSENGDYSILLEKRCDDVGDPFTGVWSIYGFVVSNTENSVYTNRIVATKLRSGKNLQMDELLRYCSAQLDLVTEKVEVGRKVFVKFGVAYPFCAQTITDRTSRRGGSVSELAITGIVAQRDVSLFDKLFTNIEPIGGK